MHQTDLSMHSCFSAPCYHHRLQMYRLSALLLDEHIHTTCASGVKLNHLPEAGPSNNTVIIDRILKDARVGARARPSSLPLPRGSLQSIIRCDGGRRRRRERGDRRAIISATIQFPARVMGETAVGGRGEGTKVQLKLAWQPRNVRGRIRRE